MSLQFKAVLPVPIVLFGAVLAVTSAAAQAVAEPAETPDDQVILTGQEGAGHSGRLAVNIASGTLNQQVSSTIIAIGDVALTHGSITQHAEAGSDDRSTMIELGPQAFSGISGLASINITAGTQNQSANMATLAIGQTGALSDALLQQTRAPTEPSGSTALAATGPNDIIVIDDEAFGQGSGLFQGNLIGGERNASANTFSLTVTASGQP